MIPFGIAALAASLRVLGDVTICQKINDADWDRPDMRSLGGGTLANGLTNILGGVIGTVGVSTSTSCGSLSQATGVTSRGVGYVIGGIFCVLAFVPKAAAVFMIMPRPAVGIALLFSASFVIVNGWHIITPHRFDARRTSVIGLAFLIGIAVDLVPGYFVDVPAAVQPLVTSSLVLGMVSAIVLNLVLRSADALRVRRAGEVAMPTLR